MPTSDAEKPPREAPRLRQAPKIGDMLWCYFPKDGQLPELWKRRPVIMIATDRAISGAVAVIPCSSQDQGANRWAVRLMSPIDGVGPSWAICGKPTTVAVSRLSLQGNSRRRLPEAGFAAAPAVALAPSPAGEPGTWRRATTERLRSCRRCICIISYRPAARPGDDRFPREALGTCGARE